MFRQHLVDAMNDAFLHRAVLEHGLDNQVNVSEDRL